MTRTMRFDGTPQRCHGALHLSVCAALCHCKEAPLVLSLRAKRSNLSLINKHYLLIRDEGAYVLR
ncbi:MAG: hypothetical protein U0586_04205 [Candidatus Brocadiaceae bacterium]